MALSTGTAIADPTADQGAGRALFNEGKALLEKNDWVGACAKFRASYEVQPAVSPLLNIARCDEHDGKLAHAWDEYARALTLNKDTEGKARKEELDTFAKKAIAELEPRIPKLTIRVSPTPDGLHVTRDGADFANGTLGVALPADPGDHTVVVSAPGFKTETRALHLDEGASGDVSISLVPMPETKEPPQGPSGKSAAEPSHPKAQPPRTWPWVVGAVSLAPLGVGIGFGVDALLASNKISGCKATPICGPADGLKASDVSSLNQRKDTGRILFGVLGGVGLVGVTVGIVGLATAPHHATTVGLRVSPSLGGGTAELTGAF